MTRVHAFVAGSLLAAATAGSPSASHAQPASSSAVPSRDVRERLARQNRLIDAQWQYTLRTNPELASLIGDARYNDRLSDVSVRQVERDLAQSRSFLRAFDAIRTNGFEAQDRLNHELMVRNLRENLEAAKFREWEMPITQFGGPHIDLAQYAAAFPYETVKDYDDYISRLRQVPRLFRQLADNMRRGMHDGLVPPKILLVLATKQTENLATGNAESSPFLQRAMQFPKALGDADRKRLGAAMLAAVRDSVLPAYAQFARFMRDEYTPAGRATIGLSALPNGTARYAFAARRSTTTTMSVEAIHALGLREVARIEADELAIARRLGFPDLKVFRDSLTRMPALHPASRQAIVDEYQQYTDQMYARLPTLFGRLPKARLEIAPIEAFREKEASTSYLQGTPDGSRPGHVYVNTYDFQNQLTINNESTAYHEGVPGHHMQVSIAQELSSLPPFRQQASYTAYVEGWALYSERLGKELGFYTDPFKDYGRLDDEMLRAIRLVVDTGIHGKGWTRQQVVDYFHAHSSNAESIIQSETDRYIAVPGQALAYKIGQLTILRLREQARAALGTRFDIRSFHDEVLGAGALPMDVLETRMQEWIAARKRS